MCLIIQMDPKLIFLGGAVLGGAAAGATFFLTGGDRAVQKTFDAYNSLSLETFTRVCGTVWVATMAFKYCESVIKE